MAQLQDLVPFRLFFLGGGQLTFGSRCFLLPVLFCFICFLLFRGEARQRRGEAQARAGGPSGVSERSEQAARGPKPWPMPSRAEPSQKPAWPGGGECMAPFLGRDLNKEKVGKSRGGEPFLFREAFGKRI